MSSFRVPHTLILLFGMIVFALLLTYVLPQGNFERVANEQGREQVVPGSYSQAEETIRLNPLTVFTVIPRGFAAAEEIIFFVLLVGGFFGVLRATGAIDAMIGALLPILGRQPGLLIGGGILLFAAGSSTFGMAEEYIPFVPVLLALVIGLGFDAMVAIGILCVGYGVGYGVATINPFTVLIAQGVAELQPTSGWAYKLALMVPFSAIGIHHVWRYAQRVRADPAQSLVAGIEPDPAWKTEDRSGLTGSHKAILGATTIGLILLIWCLRPAELGGRGWYIHEMGATFLALTVVVALFGRLGGDRTAKAFGHGAAELTMTALLIGVARSILLVLEDGNVIDTVVQGIASPLQHVSASVAAVGMLVVQSLCNLFIPSGSGQAYVTMPIMAPVADLLQLPRQVAVLAYQFGDGFTNILVPTNAVLMGILGLARIPYDRWLRFILPFMIKIWIAAALSLAIAVWIGYQ